MKIDLGKQIFKRLEDGQYTITPQSWTLKTTPKDEDYISVLAEIVEQPGRIVTINLFPKGLDITASNVINHLELDELALVDVLDTMIGKPLPAYHQTATVEDKVYYNWYICSQPSTTLTPADTEAAF